MGKVSPLAPKSFPKLPVIDGVRLSAVNSGLRYKNRFDLLLAEFVEGTTVAGVFTKSSMPGAPVEWCKQYIKKGYARALIVNSGIANVFTGEAGHKTVEKTAKGIAKTIGCKSYEVFVSSTGIIGVPIDDSKLLKSFPELYDRLSETEWQSAASSILTTDTYSKAATRTAYIGDTKIKLNGFCKGSGMIAPNMATMLAYVFTDAKIPPKILQAIFSSDIEQSFNSITVDSDTSTSDTAMIFATGTAEHPKIKSLGDPLLKDFKKKLEELLIEMAQLIVKDGEGAKKFITITVKGAASSQSAKKIGLSIANSPLVKTALAAADANWGRIIAAIGKSAEKANRDKTSIWIGNQLVATKGGLNPKYIEGPTAKYMQGENIEITVDVGVARSKWTVWTCDLTHDYISINADYRS